MSLKSRQWWSPNHTGPSTHLKPVAIRSTAALNCRYRSKRGSSTRRAGSGYRAGASAQRSDGNGGNDTVDHNGMTRGIAVITGGGSGIGAASALALAGDGWTVVLAGRRPEALADVAARGAALPGVLDAVPADVTSEEDVRALFATVVARHRRVDLLFNNAGTGAPARELDEVPLAEWNAVVAVNLTGVFLCTREAFGIMRRQAPQGGRIINNGSIAA